VNLAFGAQKSCSAKNKVDKEKRISNNKKMNKITREEIKDNLEIWLQKAELGESVQVLVNEQVIIELKPVKNEKEKVRPYGLCAGDFTVPDNFDEPLPKEILADFE
jgi:antitoxin (DNA-binding transcriptional repressor) of toxin-antitoxin stability system